MTAFAEAMQRLKVEPLTIHNPSRDGFKPQEEITRQNYLALVGHYTVQNFSNTAFPGIGDLNFNLGLMGLEAALPEPLNLDHDHKVTLRRLIAGHLEQNPSLARDPNFIANLAQTFEEIYHLHRLKDPSSPMRQVTEKAQEAMKRIRLFLETPEHSAKLSPEAKQGLENFLEQAQKGYKLLLQPGSTSLDMARGAYPLLAEAAGVLNRHSAPEAAQQILALRSSLAEKLTQEQKPGTDYRRQAEGSLTVVEQALALLKQQTDPQILAELANITPELKIVVDNMKDELPKTANYMQAWSQYGDAMHALLQQTVAALDKEHPKESLGILDPRLELRNSINDIAERTYYVIRGNEEANPGAKKPEKKTEKTEEEKEEEEEKPKEVLGWFREKYRKEVLPKEIRYAELVLGYLEACRGCSIAEAQPDLLRSANTMSTLMQILGDDAPEDLKRDFNIFIGGLNNASREALEGHGFSADFKGYSHALSLFPWRGSTPRGQGLIDQVTTGAQLVARLDRIDAEFVGKMRSVYQNTDDPSARNAEGRKHFDKAWHEISLLRSELSALILNTANRSQRFGTEGVPPLNSAEQEAFAVVVEQRRRAEAKAIEQHKAQGSSLWQPGFVAQPLSELLANGKQMTEEEFARRLQHTPQDALARAQAMYAQLEVDLQPYRQMLTTLSRVGPGAVSKLAPDLNQILEKTHNNGVDSYQKHPTSYNEQVAQDWEWMKEALRQQLKQLSGGPERWAAAVESYQKDNAQHPQAELLLREVASLAKRFPQLFPSSDVRLPAPPRRGNYLVEE